MPRCFKNLDGVLPKFKTIACAYAFGDTRYAFFVMTRAYNLCAKFFSKREIAARMIGMVMRVPNQALSFSRAFITATVTVDGVNPTKKYGYSLCAKR